MGPEKSRITGDDFSPFEEAFKTLLKSCALATKYTARAWAELEGRKPTFNDDVKDLVLTCIREQRKNMKIEQRESAEWKAYTDDKIEKLKSNSAEATEYWELVKTVCGFG